MNSTGGFRFIRIIGTLFLLTLLGINAEGIVFDVTDYGATGNGSTSDTAAINATIDAADGAGGGTVYFPAGTYLSGSIIMKNNITLEISAGATLLAASNGAYNYTIVDYNSLWDDYRYQDWGHSHWKSSLIWGIDLQNVAITGTGLINGSALTAGAYEGLAIPEGDGDRTISFKNCTGILVENVKIFHAGHFGIITTGCTDVTIDNVTIDTNRDGINIDCCDTVEITNCTVNSPGDDAICMKSSYALGYKRATENVLIDGCTVMGYPVGALLFPPGDDPKHQNGRIKFGTESNGGFKNITIRNCHFEYCFGFMLATVDGGDIENINISDITMKYMVTSPIFLRLGNRGRGPGPPPPGTYRNLTMTNITIEDELYGGLSCIASGIPGHNIENIVFNNITLHSDGGGGPDLANTVFAENEAGYPDNGMFGGLSPCYGFYLRHVDGVEFHDCNFDFVHNESRPAFTLIDVNDIELDTVGAERYYMAGDHITFDNVDNVNIHNSTDLPAVTPIYGNMNIDTNVINAYAPFNVSVNATAYSDGVCTTNLTANSALCDTAYTWLNSWHQENIELSDVTLSEPGHYLMEIGNQSETLDVYPRGDFDFSGTVNLEDFATLAKDWETEAGSVALPTNPVAWWKLDEGGGYIANDSSVNNNTATLYNMYSNWVSGYDGNGSALDFDGGNDYLRVPDSPSISVGASDYTLCAWIYPHTISHRVGIITKTEGNSNKEYAFYVDTNGRLVLEVEYDTNDGISSTSEGVVQLGQWQHVMVAFDASTKTPTFYYNFREVSGGSAFTDLPTSLNNDLYIGMFGEGYYNDNFDGIIDDVRIYNYALGAPMLLVDLNRDYMVDLNDLSIFANTWLTSID